MEPSRMLRIKGCLVAPWKRLWCFLDHVSITPTFFSSNFACSCILPNTH